MGSTRGRKRNAASRCIKRTETISKSVDPSRILRGLFTSGFRFVAALVGR